MLIQLALIQFYVPRFTVEAVREQHLYNIHTAYCLSRKHTHTHTRALWVFNTLYCYYNGYCSVCGIERLERVSI